MCTCVCVYTFEYVHIVCARVFVCVCVCCVECVCVCGYGHLHVYVCTSMRMCAVHAHTHVATSTHALTRMRPLIRMCSFTTHKHSNVDAFTHAHVCTLTQLLEEKTASEASLKSLLDSANKDTAAKQSLEAELASIKEEMQAQIHEHQQDLEKAQAALKAATSAAQVDVRAKGGGAVLDEMARERRRVARTSSALAAEAMDARSQKIKCRHLSFYIMR